MSRHIPGDFLDVFGNGAWELSILLEKEMM